MKINYPGSIKKEKINKITNYGNRGMTLEFDLNETNNYYLEKDIAVIHKNEGCANKDLARFADQINALCDKYDR